MPRKGKGSRFIKDPKQALTVHIIRDHGCAEATRTWSHSTRRAEHIYYHEDGGVLEHRAHPYAMMFVPPHLRVTPG